MKEDFLARVGECRSVIFLRIETNVDAAAVTLQLLWTCMDLDLVVDSL